MPKNQVVTFSGCGCQVLQIELVSGCCYHIEYCPKHKAGPELYEVLSLLQDDLKRDNGTRVLSETQDIINKAIAKVEVSQCVDRTAAQIVDFRGLQTTPH